VSQVATDQDQTDSICLVYPLTDLVNVRTFVDGTWGSDYSTMEMDTGLTSE